jgi:hypothetical protein
MFHFCCQKPRNHASLPNGGTWRSVRHWLCTLPHKWAVGKLCHGSLSLSLALSLARSLSLSVCLCEMFYGVTGSTYVVGTWVAIITWVVDVVYSYVCLLPRLPNFGSRDNTSLMGIRVEQINMPLSSTQLNYLFDLFVDPPAVYIVMLKFWGRWCNVCWSSPHFPWLNPMVNHLPSSKLIEHGHL